MIQGLYRKLQQPIEEVAPEVRSRLVNRSVQFRRDPLL